jgi:serine phosphatase RsbU (regulator of sigma subunit)
MMAVPLQTEDRVIGLIYVDSRLWMREFSADDLNLLTFLGNVAAIRIEQERLAQLERENQQAAEIQRRILPERAPLLAGIDLAGFNQPCHTVGGDYYDFIPYPDGRVAVVLADVAGKGISAALLVSNLQARVQILAESPDPLDHLVSRLDKSLAKQCPRNRFITMFFCMIDCNTGEMKFVNAGHNPPLVVRETGTVDRLTAAGTVLGILPELGYEVRTTTLEPGDVMAMFSDGVTESIGTNGEEFGEKRLAALLRERRQLPAKEIVDQLLDEVREFTGDAPAEDDVTLVVVRRPG